MRDIAFQPVCELGLVVGIDLRVVASPRHRYVREPSIHKLFAGAFGLDVHEHPVGRLPLAAVARYRVAVVEMPAFARFE